MNIKLILKYLKSRIAPAFLVSIKFMGLRKEGGLTIFSNPPNLRRFF